MKEVIMTQISVNELKEFIKEAVEESLPKPPPKRYKTLEAAKYLGISTITLHDWKNKGKINAKKVGNGLRFTQDELDRLINDTPRLKQKQRL